MHQCIKNSSMHSWNFDCGEKREISKKECNNEQWIGIVAVVRVTLWAHKLIFNSGVPKCNYKRVFNFIDAQSRGRDLRFVTQGHQKFFIANLLLLFCCSTSRSLQCVCEFYEIETFAFFITLPTFAKCLRDTLKPKKNLLHKFAQWGSHKRVKCSSSFLLARYVIRIQTWKFIF